MLITMTKIRLTRPAILYATGEATLSNEKAMIFWPKCTVPLKMKVRVNEVEGDFNRGDNGPPKKYCHTIPPPSLYNHIGIISRKAIPLE